MRCRAGFLIQGSFATVFMASRMNPSSPLCAQRMPARLMAGSSSPILGMGRAWQPSSMAAASRPQWASPPLAAWSWVPVLAILILACCYLLSIPGMDAAALNSVVNHQAGLLGLSGISADMRDLLDREQEDPRAAEAVALFCYQARKFLGALTVVLGGLDTLIFTGGIGEHASSIRQRICEGLDFLGIALDWQRNEAHAPIISCDGGPVVIRIMHTNEDLMIARHTYHLLLQGSTSHVHL